MLLSGYTYSFLDVVATLQGPGGNINLGVGAGTAAEGISFTHTDEKNTVTTGSDGDIMHSLHASMTGRIAVRLLKTSPTNALLNQLFHSQRLGAGANWGQNTISISNTVSGDSIVGTKMAFVKHPDLAYATEGNTVDWEFVGIVIPDIGTGVVDASAAA